MSERTVANLSASIHQRLLALSRERNADFNNLLTRYALERLLYRLSVSTFSARFVLKGALLFEVWSAEKFRTTKDADFLLVGTSTLAQLEEAFRTVCLTPVVDDGLRFLPETVTAQEIREDKAYQGIRITLLAMLGVARIHVQIDVGFGDAVVPAPVVAEFPSLLGHPPARMANYTRESSIAEKFEALVTLGLPNSRMKDLYDIWALSQRFGFVGEELVEAIEATFKRRGTIVPTAPPAAFTSDFADDRTKRAQWAAFRNKTRFGLPPPEALDDLLRAIARFLLPPTRAAAQRAAFGKRWPPGGPWS
jgi:predicted nucleotidyltransferase component of viral defense system